jgi:hypothetical protein
MEVAWKEGTAEVRPIERKTGSYPRREFMFHGCVRRKFEHINYVVI